MAEHLKGMTFLIIARDIDAALDLQDGIDDEGATVLTAYRKARALALVQHGSIAGVVIDGSIYNDDAELRSGLLERGIPFVVHQANPDPAAVVTELNALVHSSSADGIEYSRRATIVPRMY